MGASQGYRGHETGIEGADQRADKSRLGYGEYKEREQTLVTPPEDDNNGSQDLEMRTDGESK